jgi:hypothetical protein
MRIKTKIRRFIKNIKQEIEFYIKKFEPYRQAIEPYIKELIVYLVIFILVVNLNLADKKYDGKETVAVGAWFLFVLHLFGAIFIRIFKINYVRPEIGNFWEIGLTKKAVFFRVFELILFNLFVFIYSRNFPVENPFIVWLAGILVVTSVSFVVYKISEKVAKKFRKRKEKIILFHQEMSKHFKKEWWRYFRNELMNLYYNSIIWIKKKLTYVKTTRAAN